MRVKPRVALPVPFDRRPFGVGVAHESGLGVGRLRGGDLVRPFHGTRLATSVPVTVVLRCHAFAEVMDQQEAFSHVTAAILLGLPIPLRLQRRDKLDVSSIAPRRARRGAGVIGHQLLVDDVAIVSVSGLRVTSPIDTWCYLSSTLTVHELIVVGDALVCRRQPSATMDDLRHAVARYAGRRGSRRLAQAMERIRPGTDSPRETDLRELIVADGLPEPEVNALIFDRNGRRIARGDLLFRAFKVLVEYDGGQHREDERQFNIDIDRLDDVMAEGWRVIRVNKSHLNGDRRRILGKIRAALLERGWRPPT